MELYQQLKRIREAKGLSQFKVAQKAGIPQATISGFERGSAQSLRNLLAYIEGVGAEVRIGPAGIEVKEASFPPPTEPEGEVWE